MQSSKQSYPLNTEWCFWYASRKEKDHHIPYEARLTKLSSFDTLEGFYLSYLYWKPIDEMDRNIDIGLFKAGYQPLWESCPESAFWFTRFSQTDSAKEINYKWEKIVFSWIGEQYDEPHILGAVISIRGRETIIQLWFNFFQSDEIKNKIAKKFREVINIESGETVYFKDNKQSIVDKSTLKNAETYSFKKQRKFTYN